MRERALPCRLHASEDAAHLQQGAVGDVRPLAALPREHVPHRAERRADEPEGDELPGHMLVFASEAASYRDLPMRFTSRRRCIATKRRACSPGSPASASSRRTTRTASSWSRRSARRSSAAALVQRVYGDFGLGLHVKLSTRPAEFSARRRPGITPRRELQPRARRGRGLLRRTKATARSTGRRSTSTSPTRSAASGSARRFQLDYQQPENFDLKYTGARQRRALAGS
jgi:hypothetical protein